MTTQTQSSDRKRKIRAILAGGVVLGVGAAVTLAAWNDSVFVQGDFAVGDFNIQGNVHDGTGWQEYDTAGTAGTMQFVIAPDNLAPGDTVYAPVSLRVDPTANSYDADIELRGGEWGLASDDLATALTYTVYTGVTPANCTLQNTTGGTALVGPDATLDTGAGTVPGSPAFTLDRGDDPGIEICFAVTLPYGVDMTAVPANSEATVVWEFYAEPVS
ncbi:hypothetical protein IEU95_14910 [Hoyosella rhizosphaerae]|uniref:SipW-cognate class signal peptide n=1 Tax=Hoyosella rhizosphaerae TaxID=1755582 RepID=A0A916UH11_9ACTN|nr:SipW-dependent-type signal peptide-containing protein [Hoyosella rhizosphaerae]MBN4928128.1 hypothetical protein [Hoyosella rhizosphaerae]GGC72581.1 hypothetical protein GCM10011410_27090 [Hoyosella rhizosphaerae]